MRSSLLGHVSACILGVLLVSLTGCAGSPSSKFYQLNSVLSQTQVARDVVSEQSLIVSMGPVLMPDYLDDPQIVTRLGKNELKLGEFDQWAGSLQDDVNRVLVENIAHFLPSDRFFVVRWTPYLESQATVPYKVEVRIERFEGILDDSVLLRAQWGVFDRKKSLVMKKQSEISEQIGGNGYDALVTAMSNAVEKLSREIADGIMSVAAETKSNSHYLPVPADGNGSLQGGNHDQYHELPVAIIAQLSVNYFEITPSS